MHVLPPHDLAALTPARGVAAMQARRFAAWVGILAACTLARIAVRILPRDWPTRIYVESAQAAPFRWRDLPVVMGWSTPGDDEAETSPTRVG